MPDNPAFKSERQQLVAGDDTLPRIPEREMKLLLRLAKLVKVMQTAQQRHFDGDRSVETLRACKDYEARVKRAVEWVLTHANGKPRQAKLSFPEPADAPDRRSSPLTGRYLP